MKTVSQNVERLLEIVRLEKRLEAERFRLAGEVIEELAPELGTVAGAPGKKWCEVNGIKFCLWRRMNYTANQKALFKAGFTRCFTTRYFFKPSVLEKLSAADRVIVAPHVKGKLSRAAVSFPKSLTDVGPAGEGGCAEKDESGLVQDEED